MAHVKESTRDRIIHCAVDLFYRDGFHSVGLDRIFKESKITKTAFYKHFESKEQLVTEALRVHDRWWRDTFRSMLVEHGGDDPREQIRAIVAVVEELSRKEDYNGCFFVNVAVEFPLAHDPAHVAAAEHKAEMALILRDLAMRAGASRPVEMAEELCLLLEGAYVTQQIQRDDGNMRAMRRLVDAVIDRHCPLAP